MMEMIQDKPFIVAIVAGILAQVIKVASFLIIEKKVNYRRFVQTDGAPNMHVSTFSALATAVGLTAGFDSLPFAITICMASIIVVDTMNVKNATTRQAEAIGLLLSRLRKSGHAGVAANSANSYTPIDIFSGVLLGILFTLLIY
jgi:acid phosphatase family membrane protein YuiD